MASAGVVIDRLGGAMILDVAEPTAHTSPTLTEPGVRIAIDVQGVSKQFEQRQSLRAMLRRRPKAAPVKSLDDVSLQVRAGELFGILGPNGAGKTTLFRLLSSSLVADAGTLRVEGLDVEEHANRVRQVLSCVTVNDRTLNWRLTARQNLEMYAALFRVPPAEVRSRVNWAVSTVGIEAAADRPVGGYSAGMKQRLLIARALLPRPKVLLLDEPTRSMDPGGARDIRRFIRDTLVGEYGCTVLLATHDGEEAFHLCDRVAILAGGKLLALDTAMRLTEEFGDAQVGVWTRDPADTVFEAMLRDGLVRAVAPGTPDSEGWTCVTLSLTNGHDASADVFDALRRSAARISRVERMDLSIAELIDRVIRARGGR